MRVPVATGSEGIRELRNPHSVCDFGSRGDGVIVLRRLLATPGATFPIAVAAVLGAFLLASVLFIRGTVREASELAARGLGTAFAAAGREHLRTPGREPAREDLEALLESQREAGLRYVALVDPSTHTTRASAGDPQGTSLEPGSLVFHGRRARLVLGRAVRRSPTAAPEPRPLLVLEFEPHAANALQAQATRLLGVSLLACAGILGLALLLARTLGQRESLQVELERGKRLAALGTMSTILAHELRNPLTSLKGNLQLLAEDVERDPKLHEKTQRVVDEAIRLEKLTGDLLSFVKSGELRRAPVDPNEILRAAAAAAGGGAIDLRPLEGAPRIDADGDRLQQALENVLRNAIQASPDGKRVEASVAAERRSVVFTVRDSGPGIPKGDEERIFEPFVTGRVRGVGLGLAITRRVVELHGGRITASNRPEGGAELRLVLPVS